MDKSIEERVARLEWIVENLGRDLLRVDRAVGEHQNKPHPRVEPEKL